MICEIDNTSLQRFVMGLVHLSMFIFDQERVWTSIACSVFGTSGRPFISGYVIYAHKKIIIDGHAQKRIV